MNRLIIIGNGFDLSHGLKTRFIDYLNYYSSLFIKKYFERVNKYSNSFQNKVTYEDLLMKIDLKPDNIVQQQLKQLSDLPNFESFISLFHKPKILEIKSSFLKNFVDQMEMNKNWVDIESLYFKSLYSISIEDKRTVQEFNEQFRFVINGFSEYLKQQLTEFKLDIDNLNHREFIIDYRQIFYHGFQGNSSEKLMFLNFNYTNVLRNHIEFHGYKDPMVNYIHGELDNEKNPIIMGFGDEHDERFKEWNSNENHELFRYIKSINYFKTRNYLQLNSFIDSGKFEVFVIGHSCGLSDRTLLREILEHNNCILIKLFYYKDKEGNSDYFEKSVEVTRHFENKTLVRQRVVYDEKNRMIQFSDYCTIN